MPASSPSPAPPLGKTSLVDLAVAALRERISRGEWPVGSRIPIEPELATLLGVSRNTVREAVRVLAFCGLLDVRQGDGTYVASRLDPSRAMAGLCRASVLEHLETRAMLEVEAARLAALRRTEDDLAALRATLAARNTHHEGETPEAYVARDLAFHRQVLSAAHNSALAALYDFFSDAVQHVVLLMLADESVTNPDDDAHTAIVDAIAAGDAEAAACAARQLIKPLQQTAPQPNGDCA